MNVDVQNVNARELPQQGDFASLRVLDEIERTPGISQRELSRRIGVSLGLTNLLIRTMARKAWIKIRTVPGRRLMYALTPRGLAEKLRKTRDFVRLSLRYYSDLRTSLAARLRDTSVSRPRVASYGAGELSEIVAEAARDAGGRCVGADGEGGNGKPDVLVLLQKAPRAERDGWDRAGIKIIDLS